MGDSIAGLWSDGKADLAIWYPCNWPIIYICHWLSKTKAKDVLLNTDHTQAAKIIPGMMEWSRLLLLYDVICSECIPFCRCWGWWECTGHFLSQVTLTFDLDIQTGMSEGPNVFSVNLAHIRSAAPEILDSQTKKTKKSQTALDHKHMIYTSLQIPCQHLITQFFTDEMLFLTPSQRCLSTEDN